MTTRIKNRNLIIGILIGIGVIFAFGWYLGRSKAQSASDDVINALNGKITSYKYTIAGLEKIAYEKEQIITQQREALDRHLIEKKELKALNLKKVNEVTMLKGKISILLDSLKHSGVIVHPCDSNDIEWEDALTLPIGFSENTEFYNISGEFDKDAYLTLDIDIPINILNIWTGVEKGTGKYIATVTLDNPFVKITDIKSVKMDVPKRKKFSVGLSAGYGIGKDGLTPYIGGGLQYTLFSF